MANVKVSFADKKATVTMKPGAKLERALVEQAIAALSDEEGNTFKVSAFVAK